MAGTGPLRSQIEEQVRSLGLSHRVRMPGLIANVPELMVHLFDVHVLPSISEGLPVVAIEACAAGLYTVCSDTITDEVGEHLPSRVKYLSLGACIPAWADATEAGLRNRISSEEGSQMVRSTTLSIESSVDALVDMYRHRLDRRHNDC